MHRHTSRAICTITRASINLRRQEVMEICIYFNQEGEKLKLEIPKDGAGNVHVEDADESYPRDCEEGDDSEKIPVSLQQKKAVSDDDHCEKRVWNNGSLWNRGF